MAEANASTELNARLDAARTAQNQDAEAAIWKERDDKQTEFQARVDSLERQVSLVPLRYQAVDLLAPELGLVSGDRDEHG